MASNRALNADITITGMDQASRFNWMANTTDLVNEMQTDHATQKTTTDALVTLANELRTDHGTTKTSVDESKTLTDELRTDHATSIAIEADLKTLLNNVRTYLTGDRLFSGDPALVIDTNFDVKTGSAAIQVSVDGSIGTVGAAENCDTGTSATFPTTKWGIFNVSSTVAGALTATWDTNTGSGYNDEATAITNLPATPASEASIGYVTVEAHATGTFLAGTDALTTGTGGDVANATNYYTVVDPVGVITAAVTSSAAATITAPAVATGPATITAAAAATGPGTLSNSTALTLRRS